MQGKNKSIARNTCVEVCFRLFAADGPGGSSREQAADRLCVSAGVPGGEGRQALPVPGWPDGHAAERRGHDGGTRAPGKARSSRYLCGLQMRVDKPALEGKASKLLLIEAWKSSEGTSRP